MKRATFRRRNLPRVAPVRVPAYRRTRSLENSSRVGLPRPSIRGIAVPGVLKPAGEMRQSGFVQCRELAAIQDPQGKIRQPYTCGFLDSRRLRALIPSLNRS